jgi:hypothetical protein
LTAKGVADIIRTVEVGIARRVSRRLEDELDDRGVANHTIRFLDVLVDSFPDLKAVDEGEKAPAELRRDSLLGSATMVRVLAGVYYDLVRKEDGPRRSDDEVTKFFEKFADHMEVPIEDGWSATGLFKESGMAPEASQGDLRKLVTTVVEWEESEGDLPAWLQ